MKPKARIKLIEERKEERASFSSTFPCSFSNSSRNPTTVLVEYLSTRRASMVSDLQQFSTSTRSKQL